MYFRVAVGVILLLLLLLLFAPAASACFGNSPSTAQAIVVRRVIDGDTIRLSTGERIRLIGVDTPEMKDKRPEVRRLAEAATLFVRDLVEGKPVSLEYEDRRTLDRWERTLAYVYLEDGTFVNAEIIRQGYGFAYTRYPFKCLEEFRKLEREARQSHRGLWNNGPPAVAPRP